MLWIWWVVVCLCCADVALAFSRFSVTAASHRQRRRTSIVASASASVPGTTPRVEPTYYQSDLYGVLSVPSDATRTEIRTSYMRLAFDNHPDRNNSEAALCVFRNATYAYQILKDDSKRSKYDNSGRAEAAISAIEDLAFEVAVPLINITAQAIGSYASTLLEQGKAAAGQAAEILEEADDESWAGKIRTLSSGYKLSNVEKQLADLRMAILRSEDRINALQDAWANEVQLNITSPSAITTSKDEEILLQNQLKELQMALETAKEDYIGIQLRYARAQTEFDEQEVPHSQATAKLRSVRSKRQDSDALVERLRVELDAAKTVAADLQREEEATMTRCEVEQSVMGDRRAALSTFAKQKVSLQNSIQEMKQQQIDTQMALSNLQRELRTQQSVYEERGMRSTNLDRRLNVQRERRRDLEVQLQKQERELVSLLEAAQKQKRSESSTKVPFGTQKKGNINSGIGVTFGPQSSVPGNREARRLK